MVLEDVENQLVDDAQLDFETTDKSDIASCIAIKADYLSREVMRKGCVKTHGVVAIEPLRELLARLHWDRCPFGEEVMASEEIDPHHLFAVGEGVRRTIEVSIAVDGYAHKWTPAIELALVLYKFDEGVGGRDGDVEPFVVLVCFGGCDPSSLIGLKGEIPRLIEGARDVVVDGRGECCSGRDERGRSSEGKRSRVSGRTRDSGERTS
jgi:hypothetical protein